MRGPSALLELMPAFPDMGILPLRAKTSPSLPAMPPECPAGLSQCLAAFISPVGLLGPFSVSPSFSGLLLWYHEDALTIHYAVLAVVSNCCPPLKGRLLIHYSPVRH